MKDSSRPVWLDPFTDRVPGKDGFSFDIDYLIEARGLGADSPGVERDRCAATVRAIVEPVLCRCDVLRLAVAQQDVNLCLAHSLPSRESGIVVQQCQTRIRVDSDTVQAARHFARAKQEAKAGDIRRSALRAEMQFLESEALANPMTLQLYIHAVALFEGKPVSGTSAAEAKSLASLVEKWSSDNTWVSVAKIVHEHLDSLPPQEISALFATLERSISDHQNPALLKRLREIQ